jgi:hypothetical protein
MSYHRVCNKSNKTGATRGAGTAYLFGVHPQFCGVRAAPSLIFCVEFCGSLFVLVSFFVWNLICLFFDLWLLVTPWPCYLLVTPLISSCFPFLSSFYPLYIFLFPPFFLLFPPFISSCYPLDFFLFPPCYLLVTPLISSCYPLDIFLLPPLISSCYPLDIFLLPPWYLPVTPLISSCYLLISSNLN